MAAVTSESPTEDDFQELKEKCKTLSDDDPSQTLTEGALRRFLRAHGSVAAAHTAVVKYLKWYKDYGVAGLTADNEDVQREAATGKAQVLQHRDKMGRPVIYIAVRKHNAYERDIDRLTKFIIYILERACSQCIEDVIDNLCIVFDMREFSFGNMDYQFVKNLIWLLSKYYPERLGACLIINAPIVFYGCWAIIRPWLNEVTASKVTFVGDSQLPEYLCPDILPQD